MSSKLEKYSANEVAQKDGFDLILEAFNAIIRGMGKAKKAIEEKDYLEQNRVMNACTNLLVELRNSLPHSKEFEELRTSLVTIFSYAEKKITEANIKADIAILDEISELFSKMHKQTDTMKLLPHFKEIQKEHEIFVESTHSTKRVSLQIDASPENEDILQFLNAYQSSQYKKMNDLEQSSPNNEI